MLSVSQAVSSPTFAFARANGYGIADAIEQARSSAASRRCAEAAITETLRRSRAARKGRAA